MKQQTAVEWLIENTAMSNDIWADEINQAKEKSEEEMMNFANWCRIYDNKYPNQIWSIQQLFDKYRKIYESQGSPDTFSPNTKNK
jgi:hypothetical protein